MATYWDSADAYREQGATMWDAANGVISTMCECDPASEYCDCYGDAVDWWDTILSQLVDCGWGRPHDWAIQGLPLWAGDVDGIARVTTPADLLRAVTVNGDYRLQWELGHDDRVLSLTLWHHDVPMGRSFTARPVADDDDSE